MLYFIEFRIQNSNLKRTLLDLVWSFPIAVSHFLAKFGSFGIWNSLSVLLLQFVTQQYLSFDLTILLAYKMVRLYVKMSFFYENNFFHVKCTFLLFTILRVSKLCGLLWRNILLLRLLLLCQLAGSKNLRISQPISNFIQLIDYIATKLQIFTDDL